MRFYTLWLLIIAVILAGCAKNTPQTSVYDPFEKGNRAIFAFNQSVDKTVIYPVLRGYRAITPQIVRDGVYNFLVNLRSPITIMNQALQGDAQGTGKAFTRMAINTLVGFGGLVDVAGKEGIQHEEEDFGQTLAVWGIAGGPYFVLPILGSSNIRDYTGYYVDYYANPLTHYLHNIEQEEWNYIRAGASYLTLREGLMDGMQSLNDNAIDPYAATRSAYYQVRARMIADEDGLLQKSNKPSNTVIIPDFEAEDAAAKNTQKP